MSDQLRAGGFATRLHQTKDGEQVEILNEVCGSFGGDLWIEFRFVTGRLQRVVHIFNWL